MAGANSIFTGDKLLTAGNAGDDADAALFAKLGVRAMVGAEPMRADPSVMPALCRQPSSSVPAEEGGPRHKAGVTEEKGATPARAGVPVC